MSNKQLYDKLIRIFGHRAGSGEYIDVNVYHDHWCSKVNGGTECNCNPDIEERQPPKGH
jgi:hypothetical protein